MVVEARERSGSLITAVMADHLNREVGAVPGRIGAAPAAGTNGLLHDGAHLIRGGEDVLDVMIGPGREGRARRACPARAEARAELAGVSRPGRAGCGSADALARASQLEPGRWRRRWSLELAGYLRSDSAGRYERTALARRLATVTSLIRVTRERRIPSR